MALLSRKTDYAILILAHLHQHPEGACARQVADRFGLGRPFVANILKELCHTGFVTSQRGVKGGYFLARPAERISLCELMESLGGPFPPAECSPPTAGEGCCLLPVCPVKDRVAEVHARIREVLRRVTLAELI